MPVPKTPVHKNGRAVSRQDQVRLSGQVLAVQAVTQTHTVDEPAHDHLGLAVLALDPSHALRSLLWRQRVHAGINAPQHEKLK
jgi:hypothetical protein